MERTIVIKRVLILLLIFSGKSYAQEIPKDTLYIEFKKNSECDWTKKFFSKEEKGTIFNIGCNENTSNGSFLFPNKYKVDVFPNKELSKYPITKIEDIDKLMINYSKKVKPLLIKKFGDIYPPVAYKNNAFVTYLIEKKKSSFILYRVFWRNEGVVPIQN